MEESLIQECWDDRNLIRETKYKNVILETIDSLDKGKIRVSSKIDGEWRVNETAKKAVLLYFSICANRTILAGEIEFFDKIPPKKNLESIGIRVVPPAVARYGSYLAPGCILMPGYVNIGAYVGKGTMVDTWATVGSCAQIGEHVHLSGGVGIGGVLEPLQASPVIVEDHAFIGSRCILVEGVCIEEQAVLGANVVLTASTKIIDVTGENPIEMKGTVPARSVVIPGTYQKQFPAGVFGVPCALIIGKRKESTDLKTSLNQALRDFNIPV